MDRPTFQYLDYAEPLFTARTALPTFVEPMLPDPPRQPPVIALAVAACFLAPFVPVQAQVLGWEPLGAEPQHPPHVLQYKTGAEDPLEVPRFQQLDWFQPLSEPLHLPRPFQYETWAERPLEIPRSQQITWYQPLSEPLPLRPPTIPGTGAERPVVFVRNAPVFLPLDEPIHRPLPLLVGTGAERPVTFVRHARLDWLTALSEPQFLRHPIIPWESFVPFVAQAPAVALDWFQPLSAPLYPPRTVVDPFTVAEPVFPQPRVAPTFWYPQMGDGLPLPIPVIALLVQMGVIPAAIIPTPPAVAPDQPIVGLGHPKSFSTRPELGGGSW